MKYPKYCRVCGQSLVVEKKISGDYNMYTGEKDKFNIFKCPTISTINRGGGGPGHGSGPIIEVIYHTYMKLPINK